MIVFSDTIINSFVNALFVASSLIVHNNEWIGNFFLSRGIVFSMQGKVFFFFSPKSNNEDGLIFFFFPLMLLYNRDKSCPGSLIIPVIKEAVILWILFY